MRRFPKPDAAGSGSGSGDLRRELTLLDSVMINVGSMVGSGIFLVPAAVALALHSWWLVILVWAVGGAVSLFGALSVAELGTLYPRAGGQYVYLEQAFGPLWGFLYGWTAFAVIMTASISAVAVGFATYLAYYVPLSAAAVKAVAILSILILTLVNCRGVKVGAGIQNSLTLVKIALLLMFVLLGSLKGDMINLSSEGGASSFLGMASPFGIALIAVLWAYDGWIEITYVAGEVTDPQRNIPRSLILGTVIVIALYVAVNFAYILVLSTDRMAHSDLVAADVGQAVLGPAGATVAVIGVVIATLGSNNGFVLTGARIYYAMARENAFFSSAGRIHPTFRTPVHSLMAQGVWASLLVLTGTFEQLFTYVVFTQWVFYGMTAAAVIALRRQHPGLPRSYRTWGYPYTPIVFILFACWLVFNTLKEDPRDSAIGLGIVLLGLPAYWLWKRRPQNQGGPGAS